MESLLVGAQPLTAGGLPAASLPCPVTIRSMRDGTIADPSDALSRAAGLPAGTRIEGDEAVTGLTVQVSVTAGG